MPRNSQKQIEALAATMEVVEFDYYADASPHFLVDAYTSNRPDPPTRLQLNGPPVVNAQVKLVLLATHKSIRQYGNHCNLSACDVWEFAVMTGTFGVFKIVLNSGISQDIPHEDLVPAV